jgi:hypothetical protein
VPCQNSLNGIAWTSVSAIASTALPYCAPDGARAVVVLVGVSGASSMKLHAYRPPGGVDVALLIRQEDQGRELLPDER